MGHAANCEVCAFRDAILWGGVWDCFLIGDSLSFAVILHLTVDEFRHVVYPKEFDFFVADFFSSGLELSEEGECFVAAFHEEKGDKVGVVVDEEDVITEISIAMGEGSAYITVDAFQKACGTVFDCYGNGVRRMLARAHTWQEGMLESS